MSVDNRAYQIQVPCVVFFAVTTFVVAVRLWARVKLRSWAGVGWDDGTIVTSWAFATAVGTLMMASCSCGFGQHIVNLPSPDKLKALKLFYVAQAFYKLTINLTKVSILLLYLRIFVKKWFRITCYTLIVTVLCYMVATFAASIWQCSPIPRAWDKSVPGTCINITQNWHANDGFSIATDISILALPLYPMYTSMLPWSHKMALIVVFALGVFTTITSILRMQTLDLSSKSPDITYDIDSSIWTIIEQNLAIICACLPTCRLPLAYAFPAYFSTDSMKQLAPNSSSGLGSKDRDRTSCMSPFPTVFNISHPCCNASQQENQTTSTSNPDSPVIPAAAGHVRNTSVNSWETDPESGRYINNILTHVSSCGTVKADETAHEFCDHYPGSRGDGFSHASSIPPLPSPPQPPPDARVIRMVTHYSITYDDVKPPGG